MFHVLKIGYMPICIFVNPILSTVNSDPMESTNNPAKNSNAEMLENVYEQMFTRIIRKRSFIIFLLQQFPYDNLLGFQK